jgi:hypothetical protein
MGKKYRMSIVLGKRLESFQQVTLEAVVITEAVVVLGAEVIEIPELEAVVVLVPEVVIVDEALFYTINSQKTAMFLSRKGMSNI